MDLSELRQQAKEKLKGYCRVCPVCDGRACAGEVPGMGGVGTGKAFSVNLEALDRYRFNMRTLHEVKASSTSFELWGEKLSMPILAAPMTGVSYNMGGAISEQYLRLPTKQAPERTQNTRTTIFHNIPVTFRRGAWCSSHLN
jgi:4-hydroxymandelate oxidase